MAGNPSNADHPETEGRGGSPRALVSWCLFDWANSAFPTVVTTFVFAAYFTQAVAADQITGTSQWGYTISVAALVVAVIGPVLGAIADKGGRRKPWIAVFTLLCVLASALLWFTRPDPADVPWALVFVGLATIGFEMGMVFYNAMLPDLAPKRMIGRISGWGWGLGYGGGLVCLVVALFAFVQAETPLFGLDKEALEDVRITPVLAAAWFAVFSLPLFFATPDKAASGLDIPAAIRQGIAELIATLRRIREFADIARYLLARMIYTDGLNTLFAFGGIYAAGTFGMETVEVIQFGIAINLTAGLGAASFAWVDDWIGPKRTILISLAALIVLGAALLVIESKTLFWVFGLSLGLFVGPAQAASRSLMAHLAPAELRAEMFGLYAFSGKATAFLGPALFALGTDIFDSQRAGMATIVVFLAVGMILLWRVPDVRR